MLEKFWDKLTYDEQEILLSVNEIIMQDDEPFTSDRFYPGDGNDAIKRRQFPKLAEMGYFRYFSESDKYRFTLEGLSEIATRPEPDAPKGVILKPAYSRPEFTDALLLALAVVSGRVQQITHYELHLLLLHDKPFNGYMTVTDDVRKSCEQKIYFAILDKRG